MADSRITALGALTGAGSASTDLMPVVDVSDTTMSATGTDKRMTLAETALALITHGALATAATAVTPTGGGKETVASANATGSITIDLANGNAQVLTLIGNVTGITVAGATNGKECSFIIHWVQDATGGRTITYPSSWKWHAGTDHVMSIAIGARDRIACETLDGGTTIFADIIGQAYA